MKLLYDWYDKNSYTGISLQIEHELFFLYASAYSNSFHCSKLFSIQSNNFEFFFNIPENWGKREPGWNNLKGLWGKRATWNKLQNGWGK